MFRVWVHAILLTAGRVGGRRPAGRVGILVWWSVAVAACTPGHSADEQPAAAVAQAVATDTLAPLRIDSLFRAAVSSHGFSGAVLVASQGEVLHTAAYGYADHQRRDTLTTDHRFQLASVSKIFTATAVLQLQARGQLDTRDRVQQYLPEFPYDSIRIHHLLKHRTGLSSYFGFDWQKSAKTDAQAVLRKLDTLRLSLWFTPGSDFNYSNTNYVILAVLVERVSGLAFDDYLTRHILAPCGMTQTYLGSYTARQPLTATGYDQRRKRLLPAGGDHLDDALGDKGMYATVVDLYRFRQCFFQGDLLPADLREAALTGEVPDDPYAYGWRLVPGQAGLSYHFGWWRGYRSCFIHDRQLDLTLIILSNIASEKEGLDFWNIFHSLCDLVH
ncbi:MAG: serine hydrolase domain-containing protein [Bacteroidia bacterium]